MSNNIFTSNDNTGRHGGGAMCYRLLDPEQGEYAVEPVGKQLLNMQRKYSLGATLLSMLVFIVDVAIICFAFYFSILLGTLLVVINGIFMIVIGVKGVKLSSQESVFTSNKIPATACVDDSYYVDFLDTDNTDYEGYPIYVRGYMPIYECEYDGHKYIFERQYPNCVEKKMPRVGRKIKIFLDEYEPEKTVFSDDLERYIRENKSGSVSCVVFGITAILSAVLFIVGVIYLMQL